MNGPSLVIRADANSDIGFGHVMRCLALAQAWRAGTGGPVTFVSRPLPRPIAQRIDDEQFTTETIQCNTGTPQDAAELSRLLHNTQALVIDGYGFDEQYFQTIQQCNVPVLVVDDYLRLKHYDADLLLNQNPGVDPSSYVGRCTGELLLGLDYILLRSEIIQAAASNTGDQTPRHLLVTLGGFDPDHVTQRIIDAIGMLSDENLSVTLVSSQTSLQTHDPRIRLVPFANDMAELYRWADVAICAGGSSNWEMSWFGLPRLLMVLAENQSGIARELDRLGCGWCIGWHENVSSADIATSLQRLLQQDLTAMRRANLELLDGRGAQRVVQRLLECTRARPEN
ncbi:MAG: UDP-2,4-diacetamido-2,4,6-trideoxy-beta-L-altropyranose hydrolase [Pirellulaceae bacterium]